MKILLLFFGIVLSNFGFGQSITIDPSTPVSSCNTNTINVDFSIEGNVVGPYTISLKRVITVTGCSANTYIFSPATSSNSVTSMFNLNIPNGNQSSCSTFNMNCFGSAGGSVQRTRCIKYYLFVTSSNGVVSPDREIEIKDCNLNDKIRDVNLLNSASCQAGLLNVGFTNLGLSNAYPININLKRLSGTVEQSVTNITVPNSANIASISIPANAPEDNDYFITLSNPEMSSPISTPKNISIGNNISNINLSSTGVTCLGDEFTINSTATSLGYTYIWYKDDVDISNSNTSNLPFNFVKRTSDINDVGIYSVVAKYGNCETISSDYNKNFTSTTAPTANNVTIVSGNTATISASGCTNAANTHWFDGQTFLSAGLTYTSPPLTQSKTYGVLCNANCPSNLTLVNISINSTNAPPAPALTKNITSVCSGSPVTFTANCPGGIVKWYSSATANTILSQDNPFVYTAVVSKTNSNTVYADCRINNITSVARSSISVIVTNVFAPSVDDATINSGSNITLTANCSGTARWYDTNSSSISIHTGNSYTTPGLTSSEDYYVSCSPTSSFCVSPRDAVNITVSSSLIQPNLKASVNFICGFGTSVITATGCSNGTVNWYANNYTTTVLATGTTYTTPSLSIQGIYNYYARCTIGGNTSFYRSSTIKVFADDNMPTVSGNLTINEGSNTVLTATCDPSQTILWYDSPSSSTELSSNSIFTTPTLTTNTSYYVSCQTILSGLSYCASQRKEVNITITPDCSAPPIAYNNIINSGNSINLTASNCETGTLKWYSLSNGNYTMLQSGSNYTTPELTNNTSYYVSCLKSSCESTKKEIKVEMACNSVPTLTTTFETIPFGTSASLVASGCSDLINWRNGIGEMILATTSNNALFVTPILTQNPSYYYASCEQNSCGSTTNTNVLVSITLSCDPPNSPSADGGLFAENTNAMLIASGCNGFYNWYSSPNSSSPLQSSLSNTYVTPSLIAGNITYYVSCFESCESSRVPLNLTVLPTLKTNNTWKTSSTNPTNWNMPNFDDSGWTFALENGSSCYSGGAKQIWASQIPPKIYFRKKFNVSFIPQPATFRINVNEDAEVYINGQLVFSDGNCETYYNNTNFIDVTNYLTVGENTIAIEGTRCSNVGFLCIISNIPVTECNANISIITSNSPINSGEVATLTATGCNGTYRWYNQAAGGSFVNFNPYIVNNITTSTTYYVSCFSTTDFCESPRIAKNIIVVNGGGGNDCSQQILLKSTTDDYSSGSNLKKTNETITALNKITGTAQVIYRSNKSITLEAGTIGNPGFKADAGTVFLAEIGGCN